MTNTTPTPDQVQARYEHDIEQLARFQQRLDAGENGYIDDEGQAHHTWDDASMAHESYRHDAEVQLKSVMALGYRRAPEAAAAELEHQALRFETSPTFGGTDFDVDVPTELRRVAAALVAKVYPA